MTLEAVGRILSSKRQSMITKVEYLSSASSELKVSMSFLGPSFLDFDKDRVPHTSASARREKEAEREQKYGDGQPGSQQWQGPLGMRNYQSIFHAAVDVSTSICYPVFCVDSVLRRQAHRQKEVRGNPLLRIFFFSLSGCFFFLVDERSAGTTLTSFILKGLC